MKRTTKPKADPAAIEAMREIGQARWDAWTRHVNHPERIKDGAWAARPAQVPHATKQTSMFIGGRGSGKTKAGGEWLAARICTEPGSYALIVPTIEHGITECLEETLFEIIPEGWRHWRGSVNQVDFANGSRLKLYHAERPGKVRGPNLVGKWVDEPAEMRFGMDAWRNGQFATRIRRPGGGPPQTFVTGTPKRVELMLHLFDTAGKRPHAYHVSNGTMRENIHNLDAETVDELTSLYEGTNLGVQELDGIMVEDVEGALLTSALIQKYRVEQPAVGAQFVAMSIDPGFSESETADEVGIVIGHRIGSGNNAIAEVIDDCSTRGLPPGWAERVVDRCIQHGVSVIVYETNMVGAWIRETMTTAFADRGVPMPRLEPVTSRTSKWARAEPVGALAQKGRYRMVGTFGSLEAELTTWKPGPSMRSPNRLDAWAQLGRYFLLKNTGTGGVGNRPKKRIGSVA